MLFVEIITDQLSTLKEIKNKNTISYYINPITDINLLKQELKELKKANNNIEILNKDIHYLSLFKMELEYITEIHQEYYKASVIVNNNKTIIINPEFKQYCSLIKRELKKIIKKLEKLENKPDKKRKNKKRSK